MIIDGKQACWKMAAIQFVASHECLTPRFTSSRGWEGIFKASVIEKGKQIRAGLMSLRKKKKKKIQ